MEQIETSFTSEVWKRKNLDGESLRGTIWVLSRRPSKASSYHHGQSNTFDAVYLVALAIQAAGSLDGPSIRDQMFSVSSAETQYGPAQYVEAAAAARRGEDMDYQGASGDVDFDQNGDGQAGWDVWIVSDGQIINTETDVSPN